MRFFTVHSDCLSGPIAAQVEPNLDFLFIIFSIFHFFPLAKYEKGKNMALIGRLLFSAPHVDSKGFANFREMLGINPKNM